jgi:hypothetical protein
MSSGPEVENVFFVKNKRRKKFRFILNDIAGWDQIFFCAASQWGNNCRREGAFVSKNYTVLHMNNEKHSSLLNTVKLRRWWRGSEIFSGSGSCFVFNFGSDLDPACFLLDVQLYLYILEEFYPFQKIKSTVIM